MPYEKIGKNEPVCIADEVPFEIPDSWEWVRLGSICNFGECINVNPNDIPNNAWVLDLEDIEKDTGIILRQKMKHETKCTSTKHAFKRDQILYSKLRPYLNKVVIAPKDGYCTSEILPLRFVKYLYLPYVQRFLMSPDFVAYTVQCSYGVKMPRLGTTEGRNALIPLPPLAEQKRIVAKIEELLPHIEDYDQAEQKLDKLNTEFPDQLRKSILQWAIQGKLVPQNPDDEPASVLLDRIRAEKAKLVKAGKIKKDKHESVIFRRDNSHYEKLNGVERCIDDEVPFEIPDSWEWARCGEIFQHNTGKALNSSNRSGRLLKYITTSNLYWDRFELENLKKMFFSDTEIEKCTVCKGDLLVCEGGDFGRAAIWNFDMSIRIQNHIHRLRSYSAINTRFFYYLFYFYKNAGLIGGKGIGIQGLSSNALHALLFPVPPLAEQKRIVEAIELLFCNLGV